MDTEPLLRDSVISYDKEKADSRKGCYSVQEANLHSKVKVFYLFIYSFMQKGALSGKSAKPANNYQNFILFIILAKALISTA